MFFILLLVGLNDVCNSKCIVFWFVIVWFGGVGWGWGDGVGFGVGVVVFLLLYVGSKVIKKK